MGFYWSKPLDDRKAKVKYSNSTFTNLIEIKKQENEKMKSYANLIKSVYDKNKYTDINILKVSIYTALTTTSFQLNNQNSAFMNSSISYLINRDIIKNHFACSEKDILSLAIYPQYDTDHFDCSEEDFNSLVLFQYYSPEYLEPGRWNPIYSYTQSNDCKIFEMAKCAAIQQGIELIPYN